MPYESESIEYKQHLTDGIYKEVIAFANTAGGTIYLGMDNQGLPVGIADVDQTYTALTNGIRDSIEPDVTIFIRYELDTDTKTIRIDVSEGSYKPYYLKSKGLKPSGVYVRQGTSSVQASFEQIRRMIKDADGDVFENMRTLCQDLTFQEAMNAFLHHGVSFSTDKYISLGLQSIHNNAYTNLALLLSDQCPYTTKIAVFHDADNTIFKDAKEFSGSILRQLEDSYAYLALCNHRPAVIRGLERIEMPDYPSEAVREALLNAFVHRDYSHSGSIIININDTATEFISLGGLVEGLSPEDIRIGISQPRNRNLAAIFHRLNLIESYGTGIRKIYTLYRNCPSQPTIEITPNTFKLSLPNMNAQQPSLLTKSNPPTQPIAQSSIVPPHITPKMHLVLNYLASHGIATDTDLRTLLQVKQGRIYQLIRQMKDANLIIVSGRGTDKQYRLP